MANPTEFKDRELAMYASNHLLRDDEGKLETGIETFPDQDGNERQATVVYGIKKGEVEEIVPLEEVTLHIFFRNDIEGGPKHEAYPALRYGRNPRTRRNGPMEQRYTAEDLLRLEEKWTPLTHERDGKETTYLYGKGTVSPLNSRNLSEGFMVDYDSIEASEIPLDVAAHFDNTNVAREQYWAERETKRMQAQAEGVTTSTSDAPVVPEPPTMEASGIGDNEAEVA